MADYTDPKKGWWDETGMKRCHQKERGVGPRRGTYSQVGRTKILVKGGHSLDVPCWGGVGSSLPNQVGSPFPGTRGGNDTTCNDVH